MLKLTYELTLTEEMLGTAAANPDIHREYIASKSPDAATIEQEVEAIGVDEAVEKAMTVFPKLADGTPFIYDYQIRGFFKEVCGAMKKIKGTHSEKLKAHKKEIDCNIFVEPRCIPLNLNGGLMDSCQRPLRASTAQGERTALAHSETVPEGTTMQFTVICTNEDDGKYVKEWLAYGRYKGLGQWRNSGKGKFDAKLLNEEQCGLFD